MLSGSGSIFCSGVDLYFLTAGDKKVAAKSMAEGIRSVNQGFKSSLPPPRYPAIFMVVPQAISVPLKVILQGWKLDFSLEASGAGNKIFLPACK